MTKQWNVVNKYRLIRHDKAINTYIVFLNNVFNTVQWNLKKGWLWSLSVYKYDKRLLLRVFQLRFGSWNLSSLVTISSLSVPAVSIPRTSKFLPIFFDVLFD